MDCRLVRVFWAVLYWAFSAVWMLILAAAAVLVTAVVGHIWAPLAWIAGAVATLVIGVQVVGLLLELPLLVIAAWKG